MMTVVSGKWLKNASRIFESVAVSTAEVESSKINTAGLRSIARAIVRRCFCPPEKFEPPCSTRVS